MDLSCLPTYDPKMFWVSQRRMEGGVNLVLNLLELNWLLLIDDTCHNLNIKRQNPFPTVGFPIPDRPNSWVYFLPEHLMDCWSWPCS
mmetsp:Transcript_11305/g.27223  ORF Transcript_11305/g.27223 Transcript_11305/m.27223 type:complete len:87 (+) Transcript_11305:1940-2200(+)